MGDDAGTGRWMSYDELAAVRGIKRIGAVRLVQRHKWRRQAGNDGLARILVPHDALQPVPRTAARIGAPFNDAGTAAPDVAGSDAGNAAGTGIETVLAALREAHGSELARLTEAVTAERTRADALRDRVDKLTGRLAEAEAEGNALTIETAELTAQVKAAKAEAREAQDAAEELRQAAAARRGRGRLVRLRAAWRGE